MQQPPTPTPNQQLGINNLCPPPYLPNNQNDGNLGNPQIYLPGPTPPPVYFVPPDNSIQKVQYTPGTPQQQYPPSQVPPQQQYIPPQQIPPSQQYTTPQQIPPQQQYIPPQQIPPQPQYIPPQQIPPSQQYTTPQQIPPQPQYTPPPQIPPQPKNEFRDELLNLKKKYKLNIPEDQIDQNIEEAKSKKRMYEFTDFAGNYLKFDEKGKSFICSFQKKGFNNRFFNAKNSPGSYNGTCLHLNQINKLNLSYCFYHVTPGNYKVFINQAFDNKNMMLGTMSLRVSISGKVIFTINNFPNNNMIKVRGLSEFYIRDIKKEDFYMTQLDQNGDGAVKIEFIGNNDKNLKRGWLIDGARLQFE